MRLIDSSVTLGTVVFDVDKVGIESALRLSDVYSRIMTEVNKGYYIGNNNSIPNYKLIHHMDKDNQKTGMTCLYRSDNINYSSDPIG